MSDQNARDVKNFRVAVESAEPKLKKYLPMVKIGALDFLGLDSATQRSIAGHKSWIQVAVPCARSIVAADSTLPALVRVACSCEAAAPYLSSILPPLLGDEPQLLYLPASMTARFGVPADVASALHGAACEDFVRSSGLDAFSLPLVLLDAPPRLPVVAAHVLKQGENAASLRGLAPGTLRDRLGLDETTLPNATAEEVRDIAFALERASASDASSFVRVAFVRFPTVRRAFATDGTADAIVLARGATPANLSIDLRNVLVTLARVYVRGQFAEPPQHDLCGALAIFLMIAAENVAGHPEAAAVLRWAAAIVVEPAADDDTVEEWIADVNGWLPEDDGVEGFPHAPWSSTPVPNLDSLPQLRGTLIDFARRRAAAAVRRSEGLAIERARQLVVDAVEARRAQDSVDAGFARFLTSLVGPCGDLDTAAVATQIASMVASGTTSCARAARFAQQQQHLAAGAVPQMHPILVAAIGEFVDVATSGSALLIGLFEHVALRAVARHFKAKGILAASDLFAEYDNSLPNTGYPSELSLAEKAAFDEVVAAALVVESTPTFDDQRQLDENAINHAQQQRNGAPSVDVLRTLARLAHTAGDAEQRDCLMQCGHVVSGGQLAVEFACCKSIMHVACPSAAPDDTDTTSDGDTRLGFAAYLRNAPRLPVLCPVCRAELPNTVATPVLTEDGHAPQQTVPTTITLRVEREFIVEHPGIAVSRRVADAVASVVAVDGIAAWVVADSSLVSNTEASQHVCAISHPLAKALAAASDGTPTDAAGKQRSVVVSRFKDAYRVTRVVNGLKHALEIVLPRRRLATRGEEIREVVALHSRADSHLRFPTFALVVDHHDAADDEAFVTPELAVQLNVAAVGPWIVMRPVEHRMSSSFRLTVLNRVSTAGGGSSPVPDTGVEKRPPAAMSVQRRRQPARRVPPSTDDASPRARGESRSATANRTAKADEPTDSNAVAQSSDGGTPAVHDKDDPALTKPTPAEEEDAAPTADSNDITKEVGGGGSTEKPKPSPQHGEKTDKTSSGDDSEPPPEKDPDSRNEGKPPNRSGGPSPRGAGGVPAAPPSAAHDEPRTESDAIALALQKRGVIRRGDVFDVVLPDGAVVTVVVSSGTSEPTCVPAFIADVDCEIDHLRDDYWINVDSLSFPTPPRRCAGATLITPVPATAGVLDLAKLPSDIFPVTFVLNPRSKAPLVCCGLPLGRSAPHAAAAIAAAGFRTVVSLEGGAADRLDEAALRDAGLQTFTVAMTGQDPSAAAARAFVSLATTEAGRCPAMLVCATRDATHAAVLELLAVTVGVTMSTAELRGVSPCDYVSSRHPLRPALAADARARVQRIVDSWATTAVPAAMPDRDERVDVDGARVVLPMPRLRLGAPTFVRLPRAAFAADALAGYVEAVRVTLHPAGAGRVFASLAAVPHFGNGSPQVPRAAAVALHSDVHLTLMVSPNPPEFDSGALDAEIHVTAVLKRVESRGDTGATTAPIAPSAADTPPPPQSAPPQHPPRGAPIAGLSKLVQPRRPTDDEGAAAAPPPSIGPIPRGKLLVGAKALQWDREPPVPLTRTVAMGPRPAVQTVNRPTVEVPNGAAEDDLRSLLQGRSTVRWDRATFGDEVPVAIQYSLADGALSQLFPGLGRLAR